MSWAALIFSAFLGGIVQTVTGFGAGVVMMLFFPTFFGMLAGPAISSTICMGLNAGLAWQFRHKLTPRLYAIPLIIYGVTSVVFVRLVKGFDLHWLSVAFAGFLILLSLYSLFIAKGAAVKPTPTAAFVCSFISGVCGACFGIGGPLLALYFTALTSDRQEYTGNLQLVFCVSSLFMTLTRLSSGIYTLSMIPLSIVGILAARVGSRAGMRIAGNIPADTLRRVVYIAVGISGAIMMVQKLL